MVVLPEKDVNACSMQGKTDGCSHIMRGAVVVLAGGKVQTSRAEEADFERRASHASAKPRRNRTCAFDEIAARRTSRTQASDLRRQLLTSPTQPGTVPPSSAPAIQHLENFRPNFANPDPTTIDKMGDVDVTASQWRLVEVGRVVLFVSGPYAGKLAAIAEIVDHKRVRLHRERHPEEF